MWGALSELGTGLFGAHQKNKEKQKQEEQEYALDETAGAFAKAQTNARADLIGVPEDAKAAVDELGTAKKAVKQGRMNQATLDLHFEKTRDELFAKFPEMRYEISQYMKGQGFDHYLFRDLELQSDLVAGQTKAMNEGRINAIKFASDNGYVGPDMDEDQAYEVGAKLLQAQHENKVAVDRMTHAKSMWEWEEAKRKSIIEQESLKVTKNLRADMHHALNAVTQRFGLAIQSAGDDFSKQRELDKVQSDITANAHIVFAGYKNAAIQMGLGNEYIKQLEEDFNSTVKGYSSLFNINYEENKRAFDNMATSFGLQAQEAMPVYTMMSSIYGQNWINDRFRENPNLVSDELLKGFKDELSGLKPNSFEYRTRVALVGAILDGNKQLADVTRKDREKSFPQIVGVYQSNIRALEAGRELDPTTVTKTQNAYAAVLVAGIEMQGPTTKPEDLYTASGLVAGKSQRRLIEVVMKQDPEQGASMAQASRNTTAHLLKAVQMKGPNENPSKFQKLEMSKDGVWDVVFDKPGWDKAMAAEKKRLADPRSYNAKTGLPHIPSIGNEDMARQKDAGLLAKANALNELSTHLVETAKYDPEVKGVTPKELRKAYAAGETITNEKGEKVADPFQTDLDNLRDSVRQLSVNTVVDPELSLDGAIDSEVEVNNSFRKLGYSREASAGIVGNLIAESGLDPNVKPGDGGKAVSIAQWHPPRQAEAKRLGYDLSNINDAIKFVDWELKNGDPQARKAGQLLAKAKTAQEAADIFALYFLRPAGAETGDVEKVHNIPGRRKHANRVYGSN